MSTHGKHDLPPEAFGVELDPLPPWAREKQALAEADRALAKIESEEMDPLSVRLARLDHESARAPEAAAVTPPDAAALIREARARAEKASDGPIDVHRFDNEGGSISWQLQQQAAPHRDAAVLCAFDDDENPRARFDAEFYAHARADVPRLCAALKGALAEMARLTRERNAAETTLADRVEELRQERRYHQRAAVDRDDLRAELSATVAAHARERDGLLGDVAQAKAEIERMTRELEGAITGMEHAAKAADDARAERDRMRPVVEAMIAEWRLRGGPDRSMRCRCGECTTCTLDAALVTYTAGGAS